jgi:hypothetical protein
MYASTLLLLFVYSAAAFERDEEMINLMRAVAENLCIFTTANSSMPRYEG